MEKHFATVFESVADAIPDAPAVTHGDSTRTWAEYDDRAARIASALTAAGLQPDSKVGLYLYNCNEYIEAQYGTFKMRGVPVNVNYRYIDDELSYLLDNADAEALVFHSSLGDRVARIVDRLPRIKLLIEVADDSSDPARTDRFRPYEDVIREHAPMDRIARSEDDVYVLYTGGTTGLPKGVMYPMGSVTAGFVSGGFPLLGLVPPTSVDDIPRIAAEAVATGRRFRSVPCAPLMHGTGMMLGCFVPHLSGGHVVTLTGRSFDAHELLSTVQAQRVNGLTIVGDSFSKPIIRALDEGGPDGVGYDTSSITLFVSSGAMWTAEVKRQLLDRVEQAVLLDSIGSSEGAVGMQRTVRGADVETARFEALATTRVFDDDDRPVAPGSGQIGRVAAGGMVPLGYYKDPAKSAATFRVVDGLRYSFPGDLAQVAADGTLILLGRGSHVINTGGEKVFTEEVEEAVNRVAGVRDCLVIGLDDDRFGQAITAVVSRAEGSIVDEAAIVAAVKRDLAAYKAPRAVVFVHDVPRAPNGKADYMAATRIATELR